MSRKRRVPFNRPVPSRPADLNRVLSPNNQAVGRHPDLAGNHAIVRASAVSARAWSLPACFVAFTSLFALLITIPDILLPDPSLGWVDAWFYVGLASNLRENLQGYSHWLYQAERLTWTVPGYLANLVAPPLVANYLTKGVFYLATVFFLFGALRQTCSLRTAVFVSSVAALYSFLVHALGANHVDGAANMYFLIAIYLANWSLSSGGARATLIGAFLSGAAYFAVVMSHFVFVLILPFFAGYMLLFRAQAHVRTPCSLRALSAVFLAGATASYLAVVALYRYWGIPRWPLSLSYGIFAARNPNALIWPDSLAWLPSALWLWLPTAVMVSIAVSNTRALREGVSGAARIPAAQWFFAATYGAMIAALAGKSPLIMLPFYASYLIPLMCLAAGPLVAPYVDRVSSRVYWNVLGLLLLASVVAYRVSALRFTTAAALVAAACILAATLTCFIKTEAASWRTPTILALIVLAVAAIDYATADYDVQLLNGYRHTGMARIYHERSTAGWMATRAEAYAGLIGTAAVLTPRLSGRNYQFWYDGDDPMGMYFRSVGSFFFAWSTDKLLNEQFPNLTANGIERLTLKPHELVRDIVVLTREPVVTLTGLPVGVRLQWTERFTTAGTQYFAHYLAITHPPSTP